WLAAWTTLPERARHLAGVIRRNIELEARLIDDLLDAARISRGQLELRLANVDAHALLLDAIGSVRPGAAEKGVTITTDLRAGQHVVTADATRLRQVFW